MRFPLPRRGYSSSSTSLPPIIATAPTYSQHLILRTQQQVNSYPSHLETVSTLYRDLGKIGLGRDGIGYGFAEGGSTTGASVKWDKETNRFDPSPSPSESETESYSGHLYPSFTPLTLTHSSLRTLLPSISPPPPTLPSRERTHIYVCTHGSRDCRCSDLGEPVYLELKRQIERKDLGGVLGSGKWDEERPRSIGLSRISHIGGHKWAANVLVYREKGNCDWYGLLNASHVPFLLNSLSSPTTATPPPDLINHWRGRLGLSPSQIRQLYSSSPTTSTNPNKMHKRALGEKVKLRFETWDGKEIEVVGYEGESLMETAKRAHLESVEGICGGNLECATCAVRLSVEEGGGGGWELPPMSDEEEEQLEFAIGRQKDSRLSCQIVVRREMERWCEEGGRVGLGRY